MLIIFSLDTLRLKARKSKNLKQHKKWFDRTLQDMKREVILNSKLVQKYPRVPVIKGNFFRSLKNYNKTRKKKCREFKQKVMQKLDDLRDKHPQKYWQLQISFKDQE